MIPKKIIVLTALAFLIFFGIITILSKPSEQSNDLIIDSDMTFSEAVEGSPAPKDVIDSLCLINIKYFSIDGKLHQGQLVVNKAVEKDVTEIFDIILKEKFPVDKAIPIVKYNWSDNASMSDNNTSAFCYRFIAGTKRLSNHSFGRAIDINPFFNPVVYPDGKISPKGASYNTERNGTFSDTNIITKEFIKRGWRWGGNFNSYKDNHHFDK